MHSVHPLKHVWFPDCISSSYHPALGLQFSCIFFIRSECTALVSCLSKHQINGRALFLTLAHSHTFSHILTHSYTFTISNSFTFHKWAHVIVTLGALTHWLPDNPQHRMWQMRSSHEARSIQEAPNTYASEQSWQHQGGIPAPAQKGIDKKHLWVGCRTGQKEDMF